MSPLPLASIVINNYNYARFLGEAIDSALGQTYQRTEVIVVDDGSTDESRQVISRYAGRVVPVLKANGGQASAFNAGFAACRGEVILFLDADDLLLSTAVERAVPLLADPAVVKVHWPLWMADEHGRKTGQMFPGPTLAEGDLREVVFRLGPTNHLSAPGGGSAWSRRFLERVLPLPEDVYPNGCDTHLFELAPFFGQLRAVREPQTLYRQHGNNDHSALCPEVKVRRELRFYECYCAALVRNCESLGVRVDMEAWRRHSWWHRLDRAMAEIATLPGPGRPFILVDDNTWEVGPISDRLPIPFLERDGQYWGPPPDDATAIQELERLRRQGIGLLVLGWPAFWWLDHYAGLRDYLRSTYRCVLENERLVAFDLGC